MAAHGERGSKPAYSERFLMLDADLLGNNLGRDAQIELLVEPHNFALLRQNCCFEAFLLTGTLLVMPTMNHPLQRSLSPVSRQFGLNTKREFLLRSFESK